MRRRGRKQEVPKKGNVLSDIESQFLAKGVIQLKEPMKIFYDLLEKGAGSFTLPTSDDSEIKALVENSVPSGFGKGEKNVQDPTYRNAREVLGNKIGLSSSYSEILKGVCADISQIMGNGNGVRAELIKLNIYSPGCFFKGHVDSPKGSAFGSLVVFLPSYFEGGALNIQHGNQKYEFSFGGKQNSRVINWVAFYNDCVHEITEVKQGYRLTLSYNLFQEEAISIRSITPNQKILTRLQNSLKPDIQYIYECEHYYGNNALEFASTDPLRILKGKDAEVWIAASSAKLKVSLNILIRHQKYSEQQNKNITSYHLGNPEKIKQIKAGIVDHQDYQDEGYDSFTTSAKALELVQIPPERTISYLNSLDPNSQKYIYAIDGYYGNDYSIEEKYCELVISVVVEPFSIK